MRELGCLGSIEKWKRHGSIYIYSASSCSSAVPMQWTCRLRRVPPRPGHALRCHCRIFFHCYIGLRLRLASREAMNQGRVYVKPAIRAKQQISRCHHERPETGLTLAVLNNGNSSRRGPFPGRAGVLTNGNCFWRGRHQAPDPDRQQTRPSRRLRYQWKACRAPAA